MPVLILVICLSGCRISQTREVGESVEPFNEQCITGQAIVHYYFDTNNYFTEQKHVFCPNNKSLSIESTEPAGIFQWKLQKTRYTKNKSQDNIPDQTAYWNKALLYGIYDLMVYGGDFKTISSEEKNPSLVTIEGQVYLEFNSKISDLDSFQIYKNTTNDKVDRFIAKDKNGTLWMAKSYNWSYYDGTGKLIPRKIDFFDISQDISSKKLKITVDYISVH